MDNNQDNNLSSSGTDAFSPAADIPPISSIDATVSAADPGQPAYSAPEVPVYSAPVQQAPVYSAPVQQAPAYNPPVHQAPAYGAPMQQAPAYNRAPVPQQPVQRPVQQVVKRQQPVQRPVQVVKRQQPVQRSTEPAPGSERATIGLVIGIVSLVLLLLSLGIVSPLTIISSIIGICFTNSAKKKGFTGTSRTVSLVINIITLVTSILALGLWVVIIVTVGWAVSAGSEIIGNTDLSAFQMDFEDFFAGDGMNNFLELLQYVFYVIFFIF